eukprot:jgi/Botrbrau1/4699/Bobra.0218s0020.1
MLCNLVPVSGRNSTPYEAFFGVKPTGEVLRTWECKAFVMLQKQKRVATGPRAVPGMMIGYELQSLAYRILTAQGIKVSGDVRFIEEQLGAPAVGYLDLHTWGSHHAQHPPVPAAYSQQAVAARTAPTVKAHAGPRPVDSLHTPAPMRRIGGPVLGPPGATSGTPEPSRPSGATYRTPGPSLTTIDALHQPPESWSTHQHSVGRPGTRSPSPVQFASSSGTDAEASIQPGECSWSFLDRMRACACGGGGESHWVRMRFASYLEVAQALCRNS